MSNIKPTRTDEYGTWEQQSALVWTLIPGTETQLWHDEHPAPEPTPEPTPDDDAITAEEALAILLGGDTE